MSLAGFIRKQFVDVIQWTEEDDESLAWRFPTADLEIQQGAQLIVRETQAALFVDEGRVADIFGPGRHELRTANLPLLTDLRNWDKRFESPFKSEVYFVSTRRRVGRTWGTTEPIALRDPDFGTLRVRAHGVYAFRVADARTFFREVSGTRPQYGVAEIEGQLRATLAAALAQHLGVAAVPFLDLAAQLGDVGAGVAAVAAPELSRIGLRLEEVTVQSLTVPDEVAARLDERAGQGIVGDLGRYTQFQTARAIPLAAAANGGAAGAGVGLGAGVAMGQAMAQAIAGSRGGTGTTSGAALVCGRCHAELGHPSRFCPECGAPLV